MNAIAIWQPKFSTKSVLVDRLKVKEGKNYLYFCVDRNHPDLYSFDGSKVKKECKYISNGKITCYNIPLDMLSSEGELPKEFIKIKEREYAKYKKMFSK